MCMEVYWAFLKKKISIKRSGKMDANEKFGTAAERLLDVKRGIDAYNAFAMENGLYVMNIDPTRVSDLASAESFVPNNILTDVYKSKI